MDWYFVPALEEEISFIDTNSTVHTFTQTNYWMTESRIEKCGYFSDCNCNGGELTTTYKNTELDLSLTLLRYTLTWTNTAAHPILL